MPQKYYPYRSDLDDEVREAQVEYECEDDPLFVDTHGNLYAQVEVDEGSYHPDDKNAARIHYQPLGIQV